MAYYVVENTGKGFIKHEDNASAHIAGFPANVWVTENTAWATRVNAIEKTKEEAQAIIDAELIGQTYPEEHPQAGEQITTTLP